jgi:hypothetical protein
VSSLVLHINDPPLGNASGGHAFTASTVASIQRLLGTPVAAVTVVPAGEILLGFEPWCVDFVEQCCIGCIANAFWKCAGPGPYLPKPHHLYEPLESSYSPKRPNLLTSDENAYWKTVRQATAPCFSMSSLKQVHMTA